MEKGDQKAHQHKRSRKKPEQKNDLKGHFNVAKDPSNAFRTSQRSFCSCFHLCCLNVGFNYLLLLLFILFYISFAISSKN
ncbi:hypothetical protein FKM82_019631 [Ascaphus truei]